MVMQTMTRSVSDNCGGVCTLIILYSLIHHHGNVSSSPQCNRQLRWCPYPDCKYVVKVQYPDVRRVVCKCLNVFCFSCGASWHDPVKCSLLKKWVKKCDDDSETSNWISANTKVGVTSTEISQGDFLSNTKLSQ